MPLRATGEQAAARRNPELPSVPPARNGAPDQRARAAGAWQDRVRCRFRRGARGELDERENAPQICPRRRSAVEREAGSAWHVSSQPAEHFYWQTYRAYVRRDFRARPRVVGALL